MTISQTVIFGGAFDPIHGGHVAMIRWALAQPDVAHVLVIPCARHPYGKPMAPFADRLAMCERACTDIAQVTVSALEHELGGMSYTANTVRALQQRNPGTAYALLVGADAAATLDAWHDSAWLRAFVTVLVVPRGPQSAVPDVSSRQIRAQCTAGASLAGLVPPAVAEYIADHRLYGSQ